jgi:hypothetical protein
MTVELLNMNFRQDELNNYYTLRHLRVLLINSTYLVFELIFYSGAVISFKSKNIINNDSEFSDRIFYLTLDCNEANQHRFYFKMYSRPTLNNINSTNIFSYYLIIPDLIAKNISNSTTYIGSSDRFYDGEFNQITTNYIPQNNTIIICGQYGAGSTAYGSDYYGSDLEFIETTDNDKTHFALRSILKTDDPLTGIIYNNLNFITDTKKIALDSNLAGLTSDDDILGIYLGHISLIEYVYKEEIINIDPIDIPISINVAKDIYLEPFFISIDAAQDITPVDPFDITVDIINPFKMIEEVEEYINKTYLGSQQAADDFQLLFRVTDTSYWPVEYTIDTDYHIHIKPDPMYIGVELYACTNKQFLYCKYDMMNI